MSEYVGKQEESGEEGGEKGEAKANRMEHTASIPRSELERGERDGQKTIREPYTTEDEQRHR